MTRRVGSAGVAQTNAILARWGEPELSPDHARQVRNGLNVVRVKDVGNGRASAYSPNEDGIAATGPRELILARLYHALFIHHILERADVDGIPFNEFYQEEMAALAEVADIYPAYDGSELERQCSL